MRFAITSTLLLTLAWRASAQENPLEGAFHRLMGDPSKLVGALLDYPWKSELPAQLPGLRAAEHGDTIRIVSLQQRLSDVASWRRWESEDGVVWVDLVTFSRPGRAAETVQGSRQPHSGYVNANQLLLFSGTRDASKEAIGAAVATPGGTLLNIGVKSPIAVVWDRPLAAADRAAFEAALARFEKTLDVVARALFDPAYVTLGAKIEAKPETLTMLRTAGWARLWSYIKYNFVYLDRRPELNWDAMLDQYMPRVAAAKSDAEYGRILQQAVALLHDGHTGVFPNATDPSDMPSIRLEPIGGKPVATAVGDLEELSRIKPGMELIEIDGEPVDVVIRRDIDPYIFSSTVQDRQLRESWMVLQGPPGSTVRTKWRALDGQAIEATLTRNGAQHRAALKVPSHPRFEYKELAGNVAYIGLNDFSNAQIDKEFDAKFEQLRGAKAWVIDLRYNGGGSSGIGYAIFKRFIDAPVERSKQSTRLYNATVAARNQPQTWYEWPSDKIEPAAGPHYQGPVYVLTSPSTCSAAEDFLIPLKTAKRITIVGEPTCGSTGQPLQFTIYGASARVCTKWDRFPDGTEFVGVGVLPDVKAARTREDVASGRDAVLETALKLAQ
jgi:C-terminal processing protease CtpA/Prc